MGVAATPPHVTFIAFGGKDRGLLLELTRSAFSLGRTNPRATMDILTDSAEIAGQLAVAPLPPRAHVRQLDRAGVQRRFDAFGLRKFAHHSGIGGYTKLILADLLPTTVDATVLVDTDTVFVSDVAPLWALRHRLARGGGVLMAKRLSTGGVCLRGHRINSGVVLMDLARMRQLNWTSTLLERVAVGPDVARRRALARPALVEGILGHALFAYMPVS